MKKLVRKAFTWMWRIVQEPKPRNYSLSKTFCANCAGGVPVVFPVYLAHFKACKFYKVLDRQNLQVVTLKNGCIAISNHYAPKETLLFRQIIDGSVYEHGFTPISELRYHLEFSFAEKDTTMLHTCNLRAK